MAHIKNLVACLLNVSEARNKALIEKVACAALASNSTVSVEDFSPYPIKAAVVNIFSDYDYNRSVITIVSTLNHICESVFNACVTACNLIDLSVHYGGHPRLGAVDLVPLHPISQNVTLDDCGKKAKDIAYQLAEAVPGSSSFLFGFADIPRNRGLVQRRKEVNWYAGNHEIDYTKLLQDVGPTPSSRYGLTGIGSIPYVMNCNVTIDSQDIKLGNSIASAIRGTTEGGLPGVQSMAFPHEGKIEIACNVESVIKVDNIDTTNMINSFGQYYHVPGKVLESKVRELAAKENVTTVGKSIIGFAPEEVNHLASYVLENGKAEFWRTRRERMM